MIAIHFENIFIVFVQILIIMQHIIKEIKAVTKSYTTKSGVKESVSKRVDIGVDNTFEIGEAVAVISKTDFDNVETIVADKDKTIGNLNDSVAKYKSELDAKTNKVADLSKEIKALKTKVAELEADVSSKDKTIDKLTGNVAGKDDEIDALNDKVGELTATVDELKPLLLTKDATITKLEKQIAVYDAMDVDELKEKASELDKSKNAIMLQQRQIREYTQLVNFKDKENTALRNQRWYLKALGRDATADIPKPDLVLIDESGYLIVDDGDESAIDDGSDSGKSETPEN